MLWYHIYEKEELVMKVVILDMINSIIPIEEWKVFDIFESVVKYDNTSPNEVIDRIKYADAVITNKVVLSKNELKFAERLQYIGVVATGYNVVDIDYAKSKEIVVTNVPSYGTDTVAEYTFGMMLTLIRRYELHFSAIRNGVWKEKNNFSFNLTPQYDLNGKTLGIIGFGKIGNRIAEIAKVFKMEIMVFDRTKNYRVENGINFVSMDSLLEKSDFVTLHCNLNENNYRMVDIKFLKKMKPSAFLLNMSRGDLINEIDLSYALNNDIIAGAGIDSVSVEPIESNNPLLDSKNIIITPHMAWLSKEAIDRILNSAVDNLIKFQKGIKQNRVV